jgi:ribosome-binding protein aMBF1 (putative translation factor)
VHISAQRDNQDFGKPDAAGMKDLDTREHEALRRLLKLERQKREWTQEQVAEKIGRRQSFVSAVESGQHRVSVVEFLRFAAALGFDPCAALKQFAKAGKPGGPGRR